MYHELGEVKPALQFPSNNNLVAPRPIVSNKVKDALKDQPDLLELQIPAKDERLLEVLIERGEEERAYWRRRLENAVTWERERRERETRRRERDRQQQLHTKMLREEDSESVKQIKMEKEAFYREKRRYFEEQHRRTIERARTSTEREQKLKAEKREKMKERDRLLKEQQDKNWWSVNQTAHSKRYHRLQRNDEKRETALGKKKELMVDEAYRLAYENKDRREAFEARQAEVKKETKEDLDELIRELDERHKHARERLERQLQARDDDLKQKKEEREQKQDHVSQQLQEAYETYLIERQTLLLRREQKIREANEALSENLGDISHRTKQKREEKAEIASEITKLISKQEEGWKKSIKKSIEKREKRMAATQKQRREQMEQTRKIALDSRLLRTKIREKYGMEDFDRKARQVQNFHKIGHKVVPKEWNESLISML